MLKKVIISGGGTGGHIFPALAIANALKEKNPDIEILFVGAEGRIEMEKVPAAGYKIIGLPVRGLVRSLTLKNVAVVFKLVQSLFKSFKIVSDFQPDVVVGVGGYASAPVLFAATSKGIPTLIQEQNSYAGLTNKLLAKRVQKVCVAYDNMNPFFEAQKIVFTGNPVRKDLFDIESKREEAIQHFGLNPTKKTILLLGGSGGAKKMNQAILKNLDLIRQNPDIQLIWQTGKVYYESCYEAFSKVESGNIKIMAFVARMDLAYSAADLVITRSGAATISELCLIGKPSILVPSPNVAEDHQTKNARALVDKQAALMVQDANTETDLIPAALNLLNNENLLQTFSINVRKMAMPKAAESIAQEIMNLAK